MKRKVAADVRVLAYIRFLLAIVREDEQNDLMAQSAIAAYSRELHTRRSSSEIRRVELYHVLIGSTPPKIVTEFDFHGDDSVVFFLERLAAELAPEQFSGSRRRTIVSPDEQTALRLRRTEFARFVASRGKENVRTFLQTIIARPDFEVSKAVLRATMRVMGYTRLATSGGLAYLHKQALKDLEFLP